MARPATFKGLGTLTYRARGFRPDFVLSGRFGFLTEPSWHIGRLLLRKVVVTMIAPVNGPCFQPSLAKLHALFLEILPRIERHARICFSGFKWINGPGRPGGCPPPRAPTDPDVPN